MPYRQEDIQEQPEPIILENEEIQNSNTELPDHIRELLEHEEKNCPPTYQTYGVLTPKNKHQQIDENTDQSNENTI